MKIYFTASTAEFNKYKDLYFQIRDLLISESHILTRDWLSDAKDRIDQGKIDRTDIKEIYKECMKALNEADLVIIEDTVSNFSTGHQITVALQRQKPTLVLRSVPKNQHFKNSFIQGIESDSLEVHQYDDSNLEDIIRTFIKKYENANQKNRFHLVLSEVERKYLDWAQFSKNKSRTKLIRDAIRKAMEEDGEFGEYLKK